MSVTKKLWTWQRLYVPTSEFGLLYEIRGRMAGCVFGQEADKRDLNADPAHPVFAAGVLWDAYAEASSKM